MPVASDSLTAPSRSLPAGPDPDLKKNWSRSSPGLPLDPSTRRARHGPLSAEAIAAWLAAKVAVPMGMRPEEVEHPLSPSRASVSARSRRSSSPPSSSNGWAASCPPCWSTTIRRSTPWRGSSERIARPAEGPTVVQPGPGLRQEPIAIIGIGCRLPGASGPEEFWRLLRDGVDAVGPVPDSRWDQDTSRMFGIPHRGGFLKDIDKFDADFFGISPREAIFIDPQHRLLLEMAWEAIEDAGSVPSVSRGRQSGFSSGSPRTTMRSSRRSEAARATAIGSPGMPRSIAANRISLPLRLPGPEHDRRHGLLVLAGGRASGLQEPAGRRMRRWRSRAE